MLTIGVSKFATVESCRNDDYLRLAILPFSHAPNLELIVRAKFDIDQTFVTL